MSDAFIIKALTARRETVLVQHSEYKGIKINIHYSVK